MLLARAGNLEVDPEAVAASLPASVQSVLDARVGRLAPEDRGLLQAAAVIGRRFDPELLAVVVSRTDIDARLTAMRALDLVHLEGRSGDYRFKHALVRDALYHSLLTADRQELHSKIAEEIERRSSNRLAEVAEVLAHHYSRTNLANKAFAYLSMAVSKNLNVYSLDEATTRSAAALTLLHKDPNCASDDQVAEFLVPYTLLLNLSTKWTVMIEVLNRHLQRIDRLGDDPRAVLIRHNYVLALFFNNRFREAAAMQREVSQMARRLGDSKSLAYAMTSELQVSTVFAPKLQDDFEALKRKLVSVVGACGDAYIQNWSRYAIGTEEFHRGRINEARETARELMQVGRTLNDPRSTGLGLALLTWIVLVADSYAEALEYSEQSMAMAVTPVDRSYAVPGKGFALILLRRTDEGAQLLEEERHRGLTNGYLYVFASTDPGIGLCKILRGNLAEGIRFIEEAISRREQEGYQDAADWYRGILCDVYLQVIQGKEKISFTILVKNLPIILRIMVTAATRIPALASHVLENPHLDPAGFHIGRARMFLGLLYKVRKKQTLAVQHLTEARRILSQFGQTPILARVTTALAELGQ